MPAPIKWTPDFELLNLENPEGEPWLSASPDGRFSLLFFETPPGLPAFTDLEERIYTASGAEQSAIGTTFSAATIEHQPASAYLPDGRRVYVWTEEPVAGGGNLEDVYAEIRFGNNIVDVARFLVTGGAGRQHDPVVAANSNGFAVALADTSVAGGQLIVKFYNIAGTPVNTVVAPNAPETVGTGSADQYRDVEITALANGNYVVVWDNQFNADVFARVYSSGGVAQSGVIDVQTGLPGAGFPDVTALADGRFVVTYAEFVAGAVRGRIFQANGTADGASFAIGAGAANALDGQAQTAALHDGRFVTVWKTATGEIAGQVMFADGTPDGAAFAVNTVTAGDQSRPTIATLADGRFAVGWESGAAADPETIILTIFDPREAALKTSASSFSDDWQGTGLADQVYLGGGNDRMSAAAGADTIYGEAGKDIVFGDAGNDRLYGGNDDDSLAGGADVDVLYGELGDDELNGNEGGDTVYGGDGGDLIVGVAGNDRLYGGNGADDMSGGDDIDAVYGGNGDDTINGGLGKDSLNGEANNDTLAGGADGDTLRGGAGNDRLIGGLAADILLGGSGLDIFAFAASNEGNDRIDDWAAASDQLEIDASAFGGGLAAGALAANRLVAGAAPAVNQAFGQFLYNTTAGLLSWDADGTGTTAAVAITRINFGGAAVNTLAAADFDIVA